MIEPIGDDIHRSVIYREGTKFQDEGTIESYNDHLVFVRYKGCSHSKGTRRADLTWLSNLPLKQGAASLHGEESVDATSTD